MNTIKQTGQVPEIGQTYEVYGQTCRIVKIHQFGTVDVETLNGSRAYRVTGLPFILQSELTIVSNLKP